MAEQNMHLTRRAFVGGAAAFGVVSLGVPSVAFADPTSADKQAEADAVRVKLDDMQSKLSKASDDYYALDMMQRRWTRQTNIDENKCASQSFRSFGPARACIATARLRFGSLRPASFDDFENWDS
ncbi:MAG: hypothetical protein ACLRX5_07310 [Slackia sp.]